MILYLVHICTVQLKKVFFDTNNFMRRCCLKV